MIKIKIKINFIKIKSILINIEIIVKICIFAHLTKVDLQVNFALRLARFLCLGIDFHREIDHRLAIVILIQKESFVIIIILIVIRRMSALNRVGGVTEVNQGRILGVLG